jgi:hypothetical protein
MKDAIIVALVLALALLGFGTSPRPQPAIQDTTVVHRASLHRTQGIPDDAKSVLQHCYPVEPRSETPTVIIGSNQELVT